MAPSDPWEDDWVTESKNASQNAAKNLVSFTSAQDSAYPASSTNSTPGGIDYRPQLRMLKRDNSQSPSSTPEPKDSNPQAIKERLLEKQQNYMTAREKIFGKTLDNTPQARSNKSTTTKNKNFP